MGLFKEVYCSECGTKTNMLTRMKLADGSCLCSKCKEKLPSFIREYAKEHYSFGKYKETVQCIEDSIQQYKDVFEVTASYSDITLDEKHGLFTIGYYVAGCTPILNMADVIDYGFKYQPKQYKDGVLNGRFEGELQFFVKMKNPEVVYETVLEYGVKVKVKEKLFGEDEIGDLPEKITTFERKLAACYDEYGPIDELNINFAIVEALSLFMIDNMDTVDLGQLNHTRDTLFASFQSNPNQVQKINTSYAVLKEILNQKVAAV